MAHPTIFWFRRDLRLADNPALVEAVRRGDGDVVALFIIDDVFAAPAGYARVDFLRRTLESLDRSIDANLIVRAGDPTTVLAELAEEIGAHEVFATADFAPRGRERDDSARASLGARGIALRVLDSPYVVAPGSILNATLAPYRVFSAFRRAWEQVPREAPVPAPVGVRWRHSASTSLDELSARAATRRPWYFEGLPEATPRPTPAGEAAAHEAMATWAPHVESYGETRNAPGPDATSRLSPHLRFGALHPRQVLALLDGDSAGRRTFRSEIVWREFYADVMFHRPDSVREVIQPSLAGLRVDRDAAARERFAAWARGETGFPLVDAGMRQLLEEGWMHNRVRMVSASFLVKHLHLDWRWGARWFMWNLIDADVASNQHGWQWTAGTGTDAAPFHRIFNPTLQAERFDPEGVYVRRYVRELAEVPAPNCLRPGGGAGLFGAGYAAPMLDVDVERREALARFAEARAARANA